MTADGVRTEVFEDLEAAAPAWRGFETDAECLGVHTHAWVEHWHRTVGARHGVRPLPVLVSDGDGPLMLLPLMLRREAGADVLAWIGGDITDYGAPLLARDAATRCPPDAFPEVFAAVRRRLPDHDVVHLEKIPSRVGSQANPLLRLPHHAYEVNRFARLEGGREAYLAGLRSQLRADTRRKFRRLRELGDVRYAVADDPDAYRTFVDAMIAQKQARYRDTDTYSLFNVEGYEDFFRRPSDALRASGMLHASALLLDDTILAAHWGIVFRQRFYYIMAGFGGGELMRHSPGRLILDRMLDWSIEAGCDVFDFTIGDEPFKRDWANAEAPLSRILLPVTAAGRAYALLDRAKNAVRARPALHRLVSRARNRRGDR